MLADANTNMPAIREGLEIPHIQLSQPEITQKPIKQITKNNTSILKAYKSQVTQLQESLSDLQEIINNPNKLPLMKSINSVQVKLLQTQINQLNTEIERIQGQVFPDHFIPTEMNGEKDLFAIG